MQLYFIRHAQSENNLLYDQTGSWEGRKADPDITELGREQTAALAAHFSQPFPDNEENQKDPQNRWGYHFTHFYTSLMHRAVATAAPLAKACGLRPVGWADLHERGGMYIYNEETEEKLGLPGKPRAFFHSHFPDIILPDEVTDAGWWNKPAETMEEADARADRVLRTLLKRHGGTQDRVAMVSHGAFYNCLMERIFNIPPMHERLVDFENSELPEEARTHYYHWLQLHNTAISRLDFLEWEVQLVYSNQVAHLPAELIT